MISVLVTHHNPSNEPYLERALDSLAYQENVKPHVLVISSSQVSESLMRKFTQFTWLVSEELDSPTKKVNFWLDHMQPEITHTVVMSNDVIFSKNALHVMSALEQPGIQSPLSNQENGSRYGMNMPYGSPQGYDLEQVDPTVVRDFLPNSSGVIRLPWVSFYAPMIHRAVWSSIGRLDPNLDKKYNDVDFCLRAFERGFPTLVNTGCYALHFGGKSTKAGYMSSDDEKKADDYFARTYPPIRLARFFS